MAVEGIEHYIEKPLYSRELKLHALRVEDGKDLYRAIEQYVEHNGIKAGFIVGGAAGLKTLHLRLPATPEHEPILQKEGWYEVVSMTGTVGVSAMHVHISVADGEGQIVGGHLMRDGNAVRYTAELGILEAGGMAFSREMDQETGWKELVIKHD